MQQHRWNFTDYDRGTDIAVPQEAGIYVVARVTRRHGLPLQVEPWYVGQSIDLNRRYRQHLDHTEPNPALNRLLISGTNDFEFWWSRVSRPDLTRIEKRLINDLETWKKANRRR